MADIPTPFGSIPSAPNSADGSTVILWVVSVLTVALVVAVIALWRIMVHNQTRAEERERAAAARCDADRAHLGGKVEHLESMVRTLLQDTVQKATVALEQNVEWFRRYIEDVEQDPANQRDTRRRR